MKLKYEGIDCASACRKVRRGCVDGNRMPTYPIMHHMNVVSTVTSTNCASDTDCMNQSKRCPLSSWNSPEAMSPYGSKMRHVPRMKATCKSHATLSAGRTLADNVLPWPEAKFGAHQGLVAVR